MLSYQLSGHQAMGVSRKRQGFDSLPLRSRVHTIPYTEVNLV